MFYFVIGVMVGYLLNNVVTLFFGLDNPSLKSVRRKNESDRQEY